MLVCVSCALKDLTCFDLRIKERINYNNLEWCGRTKRNTRWMPVLITPETEPGDELIEKNQEKTYSLRSTGGAFNDLSTRRKEHIKNLHLLHRSSYLYVYLLFLMISYVRQMKESSQMYRNFVSFYL